jgi:peptide/nickel transport system permease protein
VSALAVPLRAVAGPRLRARAGVVLAALFVALVVLAAIHPQALAGADPNATDPTIALRPPGAGHLFGTDQLGRDQFARVVYGARPALLLGLSATALAFSFGALWGLVSALGGRVVDEVAMRAADIMMALPALLLALLVVAALGPGLRNAVIAIAAATAPGFARLVRVRALVVRHAPYVDSAVVAGRGPAGVLFRHIVPSTLIPLVVYATMNIGTTIIAGASLSFLGLGTQPPRADWGAMLAQSREYLQVDWALAVFPGAAITLTVVAVGHLGRALQQRLEGRPTP